MISAHSYDMNNYTNDYTESRRIPAGSAAG